MGFLNPLLLLGILAAAVPLLIHLWSRRQAKTVDFSSLMFLLIAHRRRVRRLQLKNLLILILRILIIIFIACALARPLLRSEFSFAGARVKTSCVIILDNSYSMGYKGIAGERFEHAQKKALEVIDSLERGDHASVILMSDIADVLFKKLTTDLQQVRAAIEQAHISQRRTQVLPALQSAHALLEKSDDPNKEIYLITDLEKNGWTNWQQVTTDSGARVFLISVGESKANNVAIENVSFTNSLIGVNIPVKIEITIRNFSDAPVRDDILTLFIDGQKRREISVSVPANNSTVQLFTHRFDLPGTHIGRVEMTNDRLIIDDTRYFAVPVYGDIRVLCVGTQTVYLTLALNPTTSASPQSGAAIIPTAASTEELAQIPLDEYDIVILADISTTELQPGIAEIIGQKVHNFVRNGKSVVLFCQDDIDVELYSALVSSRINSTGNKALDKVIPVRFGKQNNFSPPLKLTQYDRKHPILSIFDFENLAGENAPNFYKAFDLELAPGSRRIAAFNNGVPAIVEMPVGRGMAILYNTSASDTNWSNLPLNPLFVPLLQQTIFYLASPHRVAEKNILVGDVYSMLPQVPGSTIVQQIQPPPQEAEGERDSAEFRIPNSEFRIPKSGIYQIEISPVSVGINSANKRHRDFFAANVDTRESELIPLSESEALRFLGTHAYSISQSNQLSRTVQTYRTGQEIWRELLIIAVILMLIEVVLANRERGGQGGKLQKAGKPESQKTSKNKTMNYRSADSLRSAYNKSMNDNFNSEFRIPNSEGKGGNKLLYPPRFSGWRSLSRRRRGALVILPLCPIILSFLTLHAASAKTVIASPVFVGTKQSNIIRSIHIDGNTIFSDGEIKNIMQTQVEGEYTPEQLQADAESIAEFYRNWKRPAHGYIYARVSNVKRNFFADGVYLWITIDEGKIGRIRVQDNQRTHERIILQELLFQEGDVFNKEDELESERILRQKPNFGKAEITATKNEHTERVDILVEVSELWTFFPAISLPSFSGGDSDLIIAVSEHNILGFGQSGRLRYKQKREDGDVQNLFSAAFTEPRLFRTHWQFESQYIHKSEGDSWKMNLLRPLYSLKTRWAAEARATDMVNIEKWYEQGQVTDEFEHIFIGRSGSLTRAFGDRQEKTLLSLWYTHNENLHELLKAPSRLNLTDSADHTLGTTIQHRHIHYIREDFLNKMGRVEDIALGYNYGFSIGYSSMLLGSDDNKTYIALNIDIAQKRSNRGFFNIDARFSNYITGHPDSQDGRKHLLHNAVIEGRCRYLRKDFLRQNIAMQFSWWLGHNLENQQTLLGGNNGLRGYKSRQFSGNRQVLLNIEDRMIFYQHSFFVLGGAVFMDIGYIWEDSLDLTSYKRSVGVGLRISCPKLNDSPVYRLDFGYALDSKEPPSFVNAFSFGIGHAF